MTDHAYPPHAHGEWALMLVDAGAVAYGLGGRPRIADAAAVTLLPPGIAHDGRAAPRSPGFRKRVAYLDAGWLAGGTAGAVVDQPTRPDLLRITRAAHRALATPGDELAAESALVAIARLVSSPGDVGSVRDGPLAHRLRDLLEARLVEGVTLAEAGRLLNAHPSHLSRAFASSYGIPPHRYAVARRVDVARRLLVDGSSAATAAAAAGFHDQAHLTRHFRRVLGTTPAQFARPGRSA